MRRWPSAKFMSDKILPSANVNFAIGKCFPAARRLRLKAVFPRPAHLRYNGFMSTQTIPERSAVADKDKWDLSSLFASESEWEAALAALPALAESAAQYKGKLAHDKETLLNALTALCAFEQQAEAVGVYAHLLTAADASDSANQEKYGRYVLSATQAEARLSFLTPEIQAIPETTLREWMQDERFGGYRVWLNKLLRLKPHILSENEERLLTMQTESSQTAHNAFSMLTNVDFDFGVIETSNGAVPLSQASWSQLMENPDRNVRRRAYEQFYGVFSAHKHTLAALYAGSVAQDIFEAKSRGYPSARAAALFPDNVSEAVYDNLIDTVHANLEPLHRYYRLRKKALKLDELRHYDVYVPLVSGITQKTSYEQAVEIIREALSPLGSEYTDTLCTGLLNGWADRYENKGKRSGAFSSGNYTGYPYILLNYKEDVIRDVFTMAHEGGHSMHSWYSARANPFMQYSYTIFEAEVASTFNEELLFSYLYRHGDDTMKAYLLSVRASDILATLHRQTMFAEYEKITHELVEHGQPLSVDVLRSEYRKLLELYFGPDMHFEDTSDLEGLRIPHFYSAFYVYKYATGISAALALAGRVINGGAAERDAYFTFLRSGGSRYPIESLKAAGVNMEEKEPVQAALNTFADIVNRLEQLLA